MMVTFHASYSVAQILYLTFMCFDITVLKRHIPLEFVNFLLVLIYLLVRFILIFYKSQLKLADF
jgi:hypothetical protein